MVDVLDIEPVPSGSLGHPIRYQVILENVKGLHSVEISQSDVRTLGLMEAFVTGAPLFLATGLTAVPFLA